MNIIVQKTPYLKVADTFFYFTELFLMNIGNNNLIKNGYIDFGYDCEDVANWHPQILVPTWKRSDIDSDFAIYDSVVEYLLCDLNNQNKFSGDPDYPFLIRASLINRIPPSQVKIIPDKMKLETYELGTDDTAYFINKRKLI